KGVTPHRNVVKGSQGVPGGTTAGYGRIKTGVPSWSSGSKCASDHSDTRTQPAETLRPIEDGSFVPWIASWLPPDHLEGRRGWIPLIPNANDPSGLPAPNGTRSVTT